ncbi:SDR family NAD(P)-dependent oxidoreductase [Gulosibacter sp. 10]|uniref:SDR family NAD(P)-dependent oxidoreductase n=1 Tax=Gulosibacter sp. 10 TaxID=1255570 RepID=UPI00097EC94C|nr:SDR family oxidoreductase [Gulosibacter sp. 10]SJM59762.1 3-oxoacyl-[acyl-carrier protein] reductase [Gulosibacter sp. 10]
MTENTLPGRRVLITGGSGGLAVPTAELLLREGAVVTLFARNEEKLAKARAELEPVAAGNLRVFAGDTTEEDDVRRAVEFAADGAALDGLVTCAGMSQQVPITEVGFEEWRKVVDLNLFGSFLAIREAAKAMCRQRSGTIVAFSSIAAAVTHRYVSAYSVSKEAVDSLVKNAADELGPWGIRVNSVRPGVILTEMSEDLVADEELAGDYVEQTPLGRFGEPAEVASVVRFLLSDESSWVTGTTISVDGGQHLRRGPNLTGYLGIELPG